MLLNDNGCALDARGVDQGSTIVPVVILTTVGLLITLILGNSVISSADVTAKSRAHIQAEIAAEAGLLFAKKEFIKCKVSGATVSFNIENPNPRFSVEIRNFRTMTSSPVAACPEPGDSIFRIVSKGYSIQASNVFSANPYTLEIEEIIDFRLDGPLPAGPAGLFGTGGRLPYAPQRFGDTEGTAPLVFSGTFFCDREFINDIVVLTGKLEIENNCLIRGDAWAPQFVYKGGAILGTATIITGDPNQELPVPTNLKWVPITHNPTQWLEAGFDQVVKLPSGSLACSLPVSDDLRQAPLNNFLSTTPLDTVIDGFGSGGCGNPGISGDLNLNLSADVVIFAGKFTLQRLKIRSADSKQRKVWIVVPDEVRADATSVPPCGGGDATEKISIKDLDIDVSKVSVMFYSTGILEIGLPRTQESLTRDFRGQMIACGFRNGFQIANYYFDPMGAPEYNLDTGLQIVDKGTEYPYSALIRFKRDLVR